MICAGIDAGSRTVKAVVLGGQGCEVLGSAVQEQGVRQEAAALEVFDEALCQAGLRRRDVRRMVATGYGRNLIRAADTTITEITCHAVGVRHLMPQAATVVDIGGQDSKIIRIGSNGAVRDFEMNDRCAAGTGRFLEMVALRIGVQLHELGAIAKRSTKPATINNMCAVFAESEIVGLLACGVAAEDIAAGVQVSICRRIAGMAGRAIAEPVVFTGGVAMVPGMDAVLAAELGTAVRIAPDPRMTGALGAALLAARATAARVDAGKGESVGL